MPETSPVGPTASPNAPAARPIQGRMPVRARWARRFVWEPAGNRLYSKSQRLPNPSKPCRGRSLLAVEGIVSKGEGTMQNDAGSGPADTSRKRDRLASRGRRQAPSLAAQRGPLAMLSNQFPIATRPKAGWILAPLALVLVLAPDHSRANEISRDAPTDQQVLAAAAATERLLSQGRAAEALTVIRPVATARPDSEQATFSMGLAALAAGDNAVRAGLKPRSPTAKENYDLADQGVPQHSRQEPEQPARPPRAGSVAVPARELHRPPSNLVRHLFGDDLLGRGAALPTGARRRRASAGRPQRTWLHPVLPGRASAHKAV